jgi:hypothetical protein
MFILKYPEPFKRYTDEERAKMINDYRAKYPNVTQTKIQQNCNVKKDKLDELVTKGLIEPLPAKVNGRKLWTKGFVITRKSING